MSIAPTYATRRSSVTYITASQRSDRSPDLHTKTIALSASEKVQELINSKSPEQRVQLATDIGGYLNSSEVSESERPVAEELARRLAQDQSEMVRRELSNAVRHCRSLPRDVAVTIAHDKDAVACPFLDVTEAFSEEDWQKLVVTVSKGACEAIAGRPNLTEGVILSLAEIGDKYIAEALLANESAAISLRAYTALVQRLLENSWRPWTHLWHRMRRDIVIKLKSVRSSIPTS